jgi:hypothetical protein
MAAELALASSGMTRPFPCAILLGTQQLRRTDRFGCKVLGCFTVGFLGRVFVEELAADRDRRFVAGRRLDTLLPDEAIRKTLHRGRWRIRSGAVAGCGAKQKRSSSGGPLLQLADDALRDIAHGVNRTNHLLLADNDIVEQAFKLRRNCKRITNSFRVVIGPHY